ncbi:hypothetical protein D0T53_12890 [Dysgonomonas sp. 216]|uniref:hypothetical protein n=1 Tax=Dysgonomonas sp. 216 TaxID=2302934 RepID=UPI0013CF7077|nr:hypothetical protein [Dysgonomonas sp. 216]NDW19796.1 hypothetical protein [Dysgonomonas sp. 216]
MKKENIIQTVPGYNTGGISRIWLLDIQDFNSYKFRDDKLYNEAFVESIIAKSAFTEIEAIEECYFSETLSGNIYKQEINSFIGILNYSTLAQFLETGSRKYLIVFETRQGGYFVFGSDGGATIGFDQQTGRSGEIAGYNVKITKDSSYPLFELKSLNNIQIAYTYKPHFSGEFCQLVNNEQTGYEIASYVTKETADGEPVDIAGNLCSESGQKQAIRLLNGFSNPNIQKYIAEATYQPYTDYIEGVSVLRYNPQKCAVSDISSIWLDKSQIIFSDTNTTEAVILNSIGAWSLISETDIATCTPSAGEAGTATLTFTRGETSNPVFFIFKNIDTNQTTQISIVNNNLTEWVLKDGEWNNNGYWLINGIW